jgi:hypothetical protein
MSARATAVLAALTLAACRGQPPGRAPAPSAAAPNAPVAPAEPPPYEVALLPPAAVRVGEVAAARVVVRSKGGFHVNRDYPMAFRPEPASLAAFGAERVALAEGAERTPCAAEPEEACGVSAPIPFTLRAPGEARLAGVVAFSVCTRELCRIEKVPVALAVTTSPRG